MVEPGAREEHARSCLQPALPERMEPAVDSRYSKRPPPLHLLSTIKDSIPLSAPHTVKGRTRRPHDWMPHCVLSQEHLWRQATTRS